MSKATTPKKTYELVAILFLLPALFIELRWMIVSAAHPNASVASRESTFLEAFPSFFTSAKILLFICLV